MGELIKYGKALAIASMATKGAMAAAIVIGAVAFATGDGGTFTLSWVPGGQ
ncbi:hypothetical protein [Marinimicrobium agarilyticum]|uniref:hypothetical protein n=1 Tax=Marinimicrobium agarilyticum TaxID=306546 RepID=UPI00041380A3|nr:hypothetical protein [Marinimicrobium agarilyticum]